MIILVIFVLIGIMINVFRCRTSINLLPKGHLWAQSLTEEKKRMLGLYIPLAAATRFTAILSLWGFLLYLISLLHVFSHLELALPLLWTVLSIFFWRLLTSLCFDFFFAMARKKEFG